MNLHKHGEKAARIARLYAPIFEAAKAKDPGPTTCPGGHSFAIVPVKNKLWMVCRKCGAAIPK